MRRKEVRARKEKINERLLRQVKQHREFVLVERTFLDQPIAIELERPGVPHSKVLGFWMDRKYYAIQKVVESRREHGEYYLRVITDRGAFDLRRRWQMDPWTLRLMPRWEVHAALDAIPVRRVPKRV
ncbi:MAG: hypothetical protein QN198_09890 [Armatimonadota bacterium]|nr:hypothetical protein [Armatimonadota bacterium]MDR5703895.1 hypothetical protein [Armatimonadota bacterium]MDR7435733.1 hypothetical protein [Armatimonadota bacterium]